MIILRKMIKNDVIYDTILSLIKSQNKFKYLFKKEFEDEDCIKIKSLRFKDFGILEDLSFLKYFKDLVELDFVNGEIKDISWINYLDLKLEGLWFENVIVSFDFKEFRNLETLSIHYSNEELYRKNIDLNILKKFPKINCLCLEGVGNVDLKIIFEIFPNLNYLHLEDSILQNIDYIDKFNNLIEVDTNAFMEKDIDLIDSLLNKGVIIDLCETCNDVLIETYENKKNIYI